MIAKYELINPMPIKDKPYLNSTNKLVIPNIKSNYKWYLEVARNKETTLEREYFILFSSEKFDEHCRKVLLDGGKRPCIVINGELKKYITEEISIRGNVEVEYVESEDTYDTWQVK